DRRPGAVVAAVGDEVAEAFELPGILRRGFGRGGLDVSAHGRPRFRIDVVAIGAAVAFVVRVGHREQAVVEPDLGFDRARGADPVDGALDLAVGAFHAGPRLRVEGCVQLDDVSRPVPDHLVTAHDAGATQADLA